MIFKTIRKGDLKTLFNVHLKDMECIGPKQVGTSQKGRPIYQFLPLDSFSEVDFSYGKTEFSAKTYFIPFKETLSSFSFTDDSSWEQAIRYRMQPRVIFGMHSCDINALLKLDKVMAKSLYPNPYYVSRRRNTMVIGTACTEMCNGGFCTSMGTDNVSHGFDLFLTDIGDRYFVKVGSEKGFALIDMIHAKDMTPENREQYRKVSSEFTWKNQPAVRTENLSEVLDIEFESEVWKKWGDACMGCGSCSMVCPTCYCYGVDEQISMDFKTGEKVKRLYSCNILDFSEIAGGHNFRKARGTRLKYRYYHQHRGFVETYGEPLCVGCNRCGNTCLSGINPVDVIHDIQMEGVK